MGKLARAIVVLIGFTGCASDDRAAADSSPAPPTLSDAAAARDVPDAAASDAAAVTDSHSYDNAILAVVAAHVYQDFPSLPVKRGSKFEVFLLPTIRPAQITRLRVLGPGGFVFDFMNVPFSETGNGYLSNDRLPVLWYQALRAAPLEPGRYSVHASFDNGEEQEHARDLLTDGGMIDFYLQHRDEMRYSPSSGVSPANDTVLTWSTLRDLGGPDAYYNAWISSGSGEAIEPETARGDMIFVDAYSNPSAGLNANSSRQGSAEAPLIVGSQVWHPEITDSNLLDAINVVIFPPGQHFTAE